MSKIPPRFIENLEKMSFDEKFKNFKEALNENNIPQEIEIQRGLYNIYKGNKDNPQAHKNSLNRLAEKTEMKPQKYLVNIFLPRYFEKISEFLRTNQPLPFYCRDIEAYFKNYTTNMSGQEDTTKEEKSVYSSNTQKDSFETQINKRRSSLKSRAKSDNTIGSVDNSNTQKEPSSLQSNGL